MDGKEFSPQGTLNAASGAGKEFSPQGTLNAASGAGKEFSPQGSVLSVPNSPAKRAQKEEVKSRFSRQDLIASVFTYYQHIYYYYICIFHQFPHRKCVKLLIHE